MDNNMPNFSQKKWDTIIENFANKYKHLVSVHKLWENEVIKTGELVGPTGLVWKFDKVQRRGALVYNNAQIYNYPIQGTSAQLIKLAANYIRKRKRGLDVIFINTVHDSIIADAKTEQDAKAYAKICRETFQELPDLSYKHFGWKIPIPIDGEVEVGINWGSVKEIIL